VIDLALDHLDLQLAPDLAPLAASQIEGRLSAQRSADGWRIAAQQFGFVAGEGLRWPRGDMALSVKQPQGLPATGGEFSAQQLDLALVAQVAAGLPLGTPLRNLLAELLPQGTVEDLQARWDGPVDAPQHYQLRGRLH